MQKIEYVSVDKLTNHPQNPRKLSDRQMKILKESIQANPDYFETRPILCNKDFVVFAGNMRLAAAKDIGLKEVPVAIMDISEERQREIMIRDNRQNGMWDFDLLSSTFETPELLSWGFSETELGGAAGSQKQEGDNCERCVELRKEVEGHQRRSGHEVNKKVSGE